jgi:HSP20 family protein
MDVLGKLRLQFHERVDKARQTLTVGWRELLRRSDGALTHFDVSAKSRQDADAEEHFPRWSLLAAETWETAQSVIVRVEMPGMKKEDIRVSLQENLLHIRGEKHSGGDHSGRRYGLTERAYGRFERTLCLSQRVDRTQMEVSYKDGVLTVILPKTASIPPQ